MAVRLKDIAQDLGVSVVTVSKALRNHRDISEETRRRVLKRCEELNYRPNLAARALITGRSCTVGLVVPDLLHPFFAQVAKALSGVLRTRNYSLIIASSEEDPQLEQQEIERLLARRVDVMLIASAERTADKFRSMEQQETPYVLIDRQFAGLQANFVGVDDHAAGEIATSHLLDQGCRRVAHIRGPEVSTAVGRYEGYKAALASRGIDCEADLVVSTGDSGDDRGPIGGYHAAEKLLQVAPRPDGIFCYNDPVALGAMRAIVDAGLRIPEDIAVIGCGNVLYGDFLRVPLSTIDQDSDALGRRAAEIALGLLEQPAAPPASVVVEPKLVARASSLRR